ncbi:hypothetical protein Goklo_011680 [Gossypium klotzschianum]|uniref:Uncharacterized protein n=2 Tax=Gossypium TaxID=3633 RepID=A0A7J8VAU0_9ROSI|nr:hypothetical protein [Gossypium klotzschianum]
MLLEMGQEVSNWASYYICFSKAALFISGLVFSHAFVEHAIFFVLITYITSNWKSYRLPIAAAVVNAQEGASLLVAAIVAYVADERLGRFKVVGYTTAAFITGLVILCFEYKDSRIFYVALLLVTLGKGGRSPTLKAFLKDQFGRNQNSQVAEAEYQNRERAEARHQFWWCTSWFLGVLIFTIVSISSRLSLKKPILISSIITGTASLFFVQGIRCYSKEPPERKITLQIMNGWRRLVPFWITLLVYCLVEAAGTTFFLEQSDYLENGIGNGFRIPLNYFSVLSSLTTFVTAGLVDFVTSKLSNKNQRKRAFVVRITLGMLVSFLCCITAWKVEVRRLKLIKEYGIPKSEVEKIPMSILWLTPQYLLLGIMSGLVEAGMEGCFYNLVPGSMKVYELLFKEIVMGMGKFLSILTIFAFRGWFGDESSTSHLDRYFLMLAMISLGSLAFFSVAAYACYWKIAPEEDVVGSNMEMEEGLAQATPASSSGEPLGNPSSAEQLITQEFSTKRVLKGASSPPYFPLHGDSMATSGWNDVGRKSLRNRSFGNRVQKGGGGCNSRSN